MGTPGKRLSPDQRRQVIKLTAQGATQRQIAKQVGISNGAVWMVQKPFGGVVRPEMWNPGDSRLSLEQRIEIKVGIEKDLSLRAIARQIGRDPATVCRELKANGGRRNYKPLKAHRMAGIRARRPKRTKLQANPVLCRRVVTDLEALWSPKQISARLRKEFEDDPKMQISHETIYKSLYVQGRGELRRELARCLRSGRAKRVPKGRIEHRGKRNNMVMISERPPEIEDRAVPGHWEGDLLMGTQSKSAIGTLVERSSRYVMLFRLPNGKSAEDVRKAMTKTIKRLPESLRRTLTVDQGREMSEHHQFRIDTGVQVYFCDPQSPWQRGSNENTNGLLRQYFPKGMDLSKVSAQELKKAADGLNGRPRETLDWSTPAEKFAEFVASTG